MSVKAYHPVGDSLVEVRLEVPLSDAGLRLDRFIQRHISRLSRNRVQGIIDRGVFDHLGRPAKAARIVRSGETFVWTRAVVSEDERTLDVGVIFEDARFLALAKPGDLVVHPTAKVFRNTVTAWLRQHRPEAKIGHRLDRETSGVLLCGKGEWSAWVKERFRRGQARKTYLAVVRGRPDQARFRVELPLMLDDRSSLKVKMRVDTERGLRSVTDFRVLAQHQDVALLECRPLTGRQHQIRVHLWGVGHPILGDKLYGVDEDVFRESADHGSTPRVVAATGAVRHLLHAAELELCGPEGERLRFSAPLPDDMRGFFEAPASAEVPDPPIGTGVRFALAPEELRALEAPLKEFRRL